MKNLALAGLIKRAAEDIAEKEHSSADPSLVDRCVQQGLANNAAREAEVLGGSGTKGVLYPALSGVGGGVLGSLLGLGAGKLMDLDDEATATAALLGSGLGGVAGLYGGVAGRNAYLEKKHPGFITSDVKPWSVAQRQIGGGLGSTAGGLGGGLLGALGGGGLGFLIDLATGNANHVGAAAGAGLGAYLGAGAGGIAGNVYGQDIADAWRQKREAKEKKEQEKKASSNGMGGALGALAAAGLLAGGAYGVHRLMNSDTVKDYLAEQADNKSVLPETLSTAAGAGVGAGGAYGAGKALKPFVAKLDDADEMLATVKPFRQQYDSSLSALTDAEKKMLKGYKLTSQDALNKQLLRSDISPALKAAINNKAMLQHMMKTISGKSTETLASKWYNPVVKLLSKNKRFAIPGAVLAAGAGAFGLHNLID